MVSHSVQCDSRQGANDIADEMTAESGAELELKLDAHYDGTSNSHAAYNLVEWVQDKRQPTESVEDFSEKWHGRCSSCGSPEHLCHL